MKNFYPIPVIGLRFQVDHITPKKIQLLETFRAARLFLTTIKYRQKMK